MPFGRGPSNYVSAIFALMEAKMTLLAILRKYKFQTAPDTGAANILFRKTWKSVLTID